MEIHQCVLQDIGPLEPLTKKQKRRIKSANGKRKEDKHVKRKESKIRKKKRKIQRAQKETK